MIVDYKLKYCCKI